jgi:hypothetical protein
MIDKALGLGCPDPAETYSSSPHIYEELDIPTDARGSIGEPRKPQAKRAPADKSAERPARNRTRNRRRTRGGQAAAHPEGTAEQSAPAKDDATAEGAEASHSGPRRRRRRPRKTAASAG